MDIMYTLTLLPLIIVIISISSMNDYLFDKKIVNKRLGGNPVIIFIKYIDETNKEFGHIGIWLWILIVSFVVFVMMLFGMFLHDLAVSGGIKYVH